MQKIAKKLSIKKPEVDSTLIQEKHSMMNEIISIIESKEKQ